MNSLGAEPLESIVAGLPGYDYVHTGTIGTDAIKVGLIYRPAVVTPVGAFQTLDSRDDARFIDTKSRPSLAQTFEVNATGARFTVVVNHLKSKGSACTDVGDPDAGDGQDNCSGTRTLAAKALVDWIATDPTGSGRGGPSSGSGRIPSWPWTRPCTSRRGPTRGGARALRSASSSR